MLSTRIYILLETRFLLATEMWKCMQAACLYDNHRNNNNSSSFNKFSNTMKYNNLYLIKTTRQLKNNILNFRNQQKQVIWSKQAYVIW